MLQLLSVLDLALNVVESLVLRNAQSFEACLTVTRPTLV